MSRLNDRQKGQSIALSTVLAFSLVVVGLAFIGLSMYFGGSNETKNATDSGGLNVVKQILLDSNDATTVNLSSADEQKFFTDVTDNADGKVTLRNINRVWSKALLVALNADSAGSNAGSGEDNANQAFTGAQEISDALTQKLTTANNLYAYFDNFAMGNTLRMFGFGNQVQHTTTANNWKTSLMDRGDESNIEVSHPLSDSFATIGHTIPSNYLIPCSRTPMPNGANGLQFLPGYVPMAAGSQNNNYWTVPFQFDEKPHMISSTNFATNLQPPNSLPASWDTAVPNAFSVEGVATKKDRGSLLSAMSWVQSNPRQNFMLSIPNSYIHIHLEDMAANYYWDGIQEGSDDYQYDTNTVSPIGDVPSCVTTTATDIIIGTDVVARGLDDDIFSNPDGGSDDTTVKNNMFNRCTEMITDLQTNITTDDMDTAIGKTGDANGAKTYGELEAGERDFYLFSKDGKSLTIMSKTEAQGSAPQWLKDMINNNGDDDADGQEQQIVNGAEGAAAIVIVPWVNIEGDGSNSCPFGTIDDPAPFGFGLWKKDTFWTPGTGWNGCLGKVRVHHWTDIYFVLFCPPC